MIGVLGWLPRIVVLTLIALVVFGPLTSLLLWAAAGAAPGIPSARARPRC